MKTEALHDKLAETLTEIKVDTLVTLLSEIRLSPPQRLPLRIPKKKTIIEKNRKRARDDGKRETAAPSAI